MNSAVQISSAFILGIVAGALITNKVLKTEYERIAQEEIDSVKEVFCVKKEPTKDANDGAIDPKAAEAAIRARNKPNIESCIKLIHREGYTDYSHNDAESAPSVSDKELNDEGNDDSVAPKPYVISPDDFGEEDGYDQFSLTLYADGIVTDDDDRAMTDTDVELSIGHDALTHFGEYEDDSVFVRNDKLKCDYEILRDERNYSDVAQTMPNNTNEE